MNESAFLTNEWMKLLYKELLTAILNDLVNEKNKSMTHYVTEPIHYLYFQINIYLVEDKIISPAVKL